MSTSATPLAQTVTVQQAAAAVQQALGFSLDDLRGRDRADCIVTARAVFSLILRRRGFTVIAIADLLLRDHSTVCHHLVRGREPRTGDAEALAAVESLLAEVEPAAQTQLIVRLSRRLRDLPPAAANAVLYFVRLNLLGECPRPGIGSLPAAYGLALLAADPALRDRVNAVMAQCGAENLISRIHIQARIAGCRWVETAVARCA